MTVIVGPLSSIEASGRFGPNTVHARIGQTCYTRTYATPSYNCTERQAAIRQSIRDITQAWQTLSPEEQATWVAPAKKIKLSPYHAYLKINCQRFIGNLPWTATYQP
jgi:hypothetical protein